MAASSIRRSKLDDHMDLVGVKTDREVAIIAGVTPENVRALRMRRSIPAAWRGETVEELMARTGRNAKGYKPRKKRVVRKKPAKPKSPRPSALDPFKHLLGQTPDKEVAGLAGVTSENVRAYRKRRGIPAQWRGETVVPGAAAKAPAAKAPAAKARAAKAPAAKAPAAKAPAVAAKASRKAAAVQAPAGGFAWRLVAEVDQERLDYVTLGKDMLEAVQRGTERLSLVQKKGRIVEVHRIAQVL